MQIVIELPDNIVQHMQSVNLSHRIMELIAADRYRQGHIGAAEVQRMLNQPSRWETCAFLKREKAYLPYTKDDLEQDTNFIMVGQLDRKRFTATDFQQMIDSGILQEGEPYELLNGEISRKTDYPTYPLSQTTIVGIGKSHAASTKRIIG